MATTENFDKIIVAEVNLAPVLSVNGQVGFVHITPSGLGLGSVNNTTDVDKPISYATQQVFNNVFNQLSIISGALAVVEGAVATDANIKYRVQLESGIESKYINYPVVLTQRPKTIHCEIENDVDNIVYAHKVYNISSTGFNIDFSDVLNSSGYFLNVQAGK